MDFYSMLDRHKSMCLIDSNPLAVNCILSNVNSSATQGQGALLPPDSSSYNPQDSLKCIPNYIGMEISTDTGLGVYGDSAECLINMRSVKIGEVTKGWKIKIKYPMLDKLLSFCIEHVAIDRIQGIYLCDLRLIEENYTPRTNRRQGAL